MAGDRIFRYIGGVIIPLEPYDKMKNKPIKLKVTEHINMTHLVKTMISLVYTDNRKIIWRYRWCNNMKQSKTLEVIHNTNISELFLSHGSFKYKEVCT